METRTEQIESQAPIQSKEKDPLAPMQGSNLQPQRLANNLSPFLSSVFTLTLSATGWLADLRALPPPPSRRLVSWFRL